VLEAHGISVRSRGEQRRCDILAGRVLSPAALAKQPRRARPRPAEHQVAAMLAGSQTAATRKRRGAAKRAALLAEFPPLETACEWCGARIVRSHKRRRDGRYQVCSRRCGGHVLHHHPDDPRPLIADRLVEIARERGHPYTPERLTRWGEPLGARDAEILSALDRLSG
jgi:hypothetical protein